MAINVKLGIFILIIATILAQETLASSPTTYEVGGGKGWTKGVDFQKWANLFYDMYPGDKLVFKYPPGSESVMEVDKQSFEQCTRPPNAKVLNTGNDEIVLDKTGPKYFTSSCPWTCKDGMKFEIKVLDPYHGTKPSVKASVNPGTSTSQTWEVGGAKGWAKGVDFQQWAKNCHDMMPGDKLVFKYPTGYESVMEVDQQSYEQCGRPPNAKVLTTGNDEVLLDKPGPKYFTSGCPWNCKDGMKLKIVVIDGTKTPVQGARKLVEKH